MHSALAYAPDAAYERSNFLSVLLSYVFHYVNPYRLQFAERLHEKANICRGLMKRIVQK